MLATNERSERLVEGLLTLARSEQEVAERTPLDLADIVAAAVEQEHREAVEHGVTLTTKLNRASIAGSPVLIERLVANLVQNAVRHSPPGAEAVVRTGCSDGYSVLETENAGVVLRPYELDGLFEPFRRGDGRTASRGVGLGLSIVRSVAQTHGADVQATPRDGGGLIVRVRFRAAQTPAETGTSASGNADSP